MYSERIAELTDVLEQCQDLIQQQADSALSTVDMKVDVTTLLPIIHDALWKRK